MMGEFITLEEAAERLGISEATLRQWVKRGRARASRRAGTYVLRTREVDRLQEDLPALQAESGEPPSSAPNATVSGRARLEGIKLDLQLRSSENRAPVPETEGGEESSPPCESGPDDDLSAEDGSEARRRPRPPRPKEMDRRKRLGRRATDMTLEMIGQEVQNAMASVLGPLMERLESAPAPDAALQSELEETRQALAQALGRVDGLQGELAAVQGQLEQSASSEDLREELNALRAQLARAQAHSAEQALELGELRQELRNIRLRGEPDGPSAEQLQAELNRLRPEVEELRHRCQNLTQTRDEFRQELSDVLAERDAAQTELSQLRSRQQDQRMDSDQKQARLSELEQELVLARQREVRLEQELDQARRVEDSSAARQAEADNLRRDAEELRRASLQFEAERTRLQTELTAQRTELEALRESARRHEELNARLESELERANAQLERSQTRLQAMERELEGADRRFEEREQFLLGEGRKLREQLNALQFKMQMADQGQSVANLEDSRKMMEQLVELQAQMEEKDRSISQSYGEASELRSKLESLNRSYYELQQRYEREKENWSQVVARQLQERERLFAPQQPPAPPPGPGTESSKPRWGLFRPRTPDHS